MVRHRSGRTIPIQATTAPVRDAGGAVVGAVGVSSDISARVQAEQALWESQRFAHATIDALDAHIAILDEDGVILSVNAAWRTFGANNGWVDTLGGVGASYLTVCDVGAQAGEDTARQVAQGIRDVAARRASSFQLEYPCHSPREQRWFTVRVTRFGGDGQVRVVVTHENITARVLAEQAFRHSEAWYRALSEHATDLVHITDARGNLLYVSPSHREVLGFVPSDLLGADLLAQIHPDDLTTAREAFDPLYRDDGATIVAEYRRRHADGSWRWVEAIGTGRLHDPLIGGVIVNSRDITARKQAEAQSLRHLENLAALRTIDMAIMGSVDLTLTLAVILQQVTRHLSVDAAIVLTLNRHLHILEHTASRGFRGSAVRGLRLHLGEGPVGRAALERRLISVPALASEPLGQATVFAEEDFVSYWAVPLAAKGEVQGVLALLHRSSFTPDQDWQDYLLALAGQTAIAIDNAQLFAGLQSTSMELAVAYDATLEGWSRALDLRDKETEGHSRRVTDLTLTLARAMGMGDEQLVHARRGALLHDIGKMGIPDQILLKPGPLTTEEWSIMRRHPTYAYELLLPIHYLRPALDIPYRHHEKWDGTGYPHGLAGERIPLAARIFAVVDVFDALRSDRPYRPGWPLEQVRDHIREQAGSHFDPAVVETFLALDAR